MFTFSPITLADKPAIDRIRLAARHEQASHGFGALYMWRDDMRLQAHIAADWFAIRFGDGGYFFPCGTPEGKRAFLEQALAEKAPLHYLGDADRRFLEDCLPGAYRIEPDPASSEYLYAVEEQAELPGKKFAHTRKHINRLLGEDPDAWRIVMIDADNLPQVRAIVHAWNALHAQDGGKTHAADTGPTLSMLDAYESLGLYGVLALHGGEAVAYMFGSALSDRMFDIHSGKHVGLNGNVDFFCKQQLCHQLINRYTLLNREEDLGLPGLRARKQQFKPVGLLDMWRASVPV